ncbi:MAG: mannose-1-phosphate guanylyltransferase [Paludibacter sp.]|nr:mannose-1-phosphate guanylyltransferase [Paludibacter sp.]MDD4198029.1 mannose-1-phosphate guanylyltransferase [Paludibacter sp.]MDD4427004.1 mannose-1-phosphate guanylyltransferase [Paludibacter sp.]
MNQNYCVIMAGGVGSRFWPFSRTNRPKQFLDFFGTGRSLLQMTYERFRKVVPAENILIVSNVIYKDTILEQLPEIRDKQVLLEPYRRNTAPCIAYAINRIKAMTKQANIIVAPSDHLILKENDFIDILKKGLDFVEKNDSLLTIGVQPSRPETGYGYIQVEEGTENPHKVKTFTEKPNAELAQVFFETGEFYWNSGIFLWNLKTIDHAFESLLPDVASKFNMGNGLYNTAKEQEFINEIYPTCMNISIDYGILEQAENVHVLCADIGWTDLGTWGSLYEMSNKDEHENVTLKGKTLLYDSSENIIALSPDKLAVIEGLSGYLVAESDNVLLICKKDDEARIRQFVNDAVVSFDGEFI